MESLLPVNQLENCPPEYRLTPISALFAYHNLGHPLAEYNQPELLIGMCMDHRVRLRLPQNFAYILRSGGANLRDRAFQISFAFAVGGVKAFALIGHTDCGMVNLNEKRNPFVQGLVENAGWAMEDAENNFDQCAHQNGITNAIDFTRDEVHRLRLQFPKILIAPLLYRVEDNLLYFIKEE